MRIRVCFARVGVRVEVSGRSTFTGFALPAPPKLFFFGFALLALVFFPAFVANSLFQGF